MNALSANEIEIVGFNGEPLVECGRTLPIARRKSDKHHCVLDLSQGTAALRWHSPEEAASFASDRRWTELRKSLPVPNACAESPTGPITTQPMVIFANATLLDVANRIPRPDHCHGEYLQWEDLKVGYNGYSAACVSSSAVETILDDWAVGLLQRVDAMLKLPSDPAQLKRFADFALCAACSRDLRWKAFLRYAAFQESDKVKRTFDRFIHTEFPQVNWEGFLGELTTLRNVWAAQPVLAPANVMNSTGPSAEQKMYGIAREARVVMVRESESVTQ